MLSLSPPSCVGGVTGQTSQKQWIDGDGNMVTGGGPQAVEVNYSRGSRVWWLLRYKHNTPPPLLTPSHLPTSPPYCFSLGAWQHPSRWRVYFCFCLFTYSCIQLFGASQGLSFHHRMQIATAANPLSSLPCRHPTSFHVSPQSLAVRTSLFLSG